MSDVKPWKLANKEWENLDDSNFADRLEFDNVKAETNTKTAPIASERKTSIHKNQVQREMISDRKARKKPSLLTTTKLIIDQL